MGKGYVLLKNANDSYETFRDNLERAKVKIIVPDGVKEIYSKARERLLPENPYEERFINLDKVNKDLMKVYNKAIADYLTQ